MTFQQDSREMGSIQYMPSKIITTCPLCGWETSLCVNYVGTVGQYLSSVGQDWCRFNRLQCPVPSCFDWSTQSLLCCHHHCSLLHSCPHHHLQCCPRAASHSPDWEERKDMMRWPHSRKLSHERYVVGGLFLPVGFVLKCTQLCSVHSLTSYITCSVVLEAQ